MSDQVLVSKNITSGNASRYLKPKWILDGNSISTEAFDLREGPPPETYVSHFLVASGSEDYVFTSAHEVISKKIANCHKGGIAILEIEEALEEVNDGDTPFIEFVDKGLPHCGLVYLTPDQEKIQEAKATLSFLAKNRMSWVKVILQSPTTSPCLPPPA
ncbi:hypothetical protein [Burkholderia cepacia]|uniref:hypothetical protein n=1 Tax=Burkholderia cepacia TaxID=292 RepID=UPI0012D93669|nr:hypothetical protein [Burkholderia cepacia]